MTDKAVRGRVFFLDEWGSEGHVAEVAAGRAVFFIPRDDQPERLPGGAVEWPQGWAEVGSTTDGAEFKRLFGRGRERR